MTDWTQALKGNWQLVPKIATETQRWAKGAMNVWHKTTCPECGTSTSRGTSANARADLYEAMLAAAPKPPAGLYEVRDDGTARRVEINDETVERVGKPIAYALCKAFGIDPEAPAKPHGEWPHWLEALGNGGAEAARAALRALTGDERHDG